MQNCSKSKCGKKATRKYDGSLGTDSSFCFKQFLALLFLSAVLDLTKVFDLTKVLDLTKQSKQVKCLTCLNKVNQQLF